MFSCDILIQELRSGLLLSELENGPNFVLIWHSLVFKARFLPEQFHFKLWCKIAFAVGSPSRVNEYLACFECGANFSWTGTHLFSYGRIYQTSCGASFERETLVSVVQKWRLPQFAKVNIATIFSVFQKWRLPQFYRHGASFFLCLLVFPYKAAAPLSDTSLR